MGQATDFLASGRVEHGQGAAAFGIAPLAIDEELGVGVGHEGGPEQRFLKCKRKAKRQSGQIVAGFLASPVNPGTA
jgi:hypothetical protein